MNTDGFGQGGGGRAPLPVETDGIRPGTGVFVWRLSFWAWEPIHAGYPRPYGRHLPRKPDGRRCGWLPAGGPYRIRCHIPGSNRMQSSRIVTESGFVFTYSGGAFGLYQLGLNTLFHRLRYWKIRKIQNVVTDVSVYSPVLEKGVFSRVFLYRGLNTCYK